MKVKIKDIADELEMIMDEMSSYYNKEDGKVYSISSEEMEAVEEDSPLEDFPEWQQNAIKIAKRVLSEDGFIALPSKYDIHEYSIMEKFCYSVEDPKISDELENAIRGSGAFRMFKDTCIRLDVIDDWYAYKSEALKDIAISWCDDNNLEYEE